jgi:hypothetical protein
MLPHWLHPDVVALAGLAILVVILVEAILASPGRAADIYRRHVGDGRHERLFLSSVSFFGAFVCVRAITLMIHMGVGPFRNVEAGGVHIHHLVWGILLLLLVGYLWLVDLGTGVGTASVWASRATAVLYGVGSALTLDEFALWLRLKDVYWSSDGRESVRAVLMFGALLSAGLWGRAFVGALLAEVARVLRRR